MAPAHRSRRLSRRLQNVIVFGATSAIAQAVCRLLARRKCRFYLIARDPAKLASVAADLSVRGGEIAGTGTADLADTAVHAALIAAAWRQLGSVDSAIVAYGVLGDQKEAERSWAAAHVILRTGFISVASLVTLLANEFEKQGFGQLVAIGSVAGDRGRKTNYVYGAAKGAVEILLQGVRHRLAPRGINVLLIKPGFVDTPMTAHLPKSPLFASAGSVGKVVVSAMENSRSTVYAPWFWKPVMLIIRSLPERVFNRLPI